MGEPGRVYDRLRREGGGGPDDNEYDCGSDACIGIVSMHNGNLPEGNGVQKVNHIQAGLNRRLAHTNHAVMMQPGDRLVLYTDGVPEAYNPSDEAYGEQRLIAEVQAHGDGPADALVERICRSVTNFAGAARNSTTSR
jgi:hypothetical protein